MPALEQRPVLARQEGDDRSAGSSPRPIDSSDCPGTMCCPTRTRMSLTTPAAGGPQLALGEVGPRQLPLGAQRDQRLLRAGVRRIAQAVDELQLELMVEARQLGRLAGAVEAHQQPPRLHPLARRHRDLAHRAVGGGGQLAAPAQAHHRRPLRVLVDRARAR